MERMMKESSVDTEKNDKQLQDMVVSTQIEALCTEELFKQAQLDLEYEKHRLNKYKEKLLLEIEEYNQLKKH